MATLLPASIESRVSLAASLQSQPDSLELYSLSHLSETGQGRCLEPGGTSPGQSIALVVSQTVFSLAVVRETAFWPSRPRSRHTKYQSQYRDWYRDF